DEAVARLPAAPRLYRVAGDLVAIRAGDRAAALLEAFTPMRASDDGDAVALEVFIFDAVSDKLALPATAITHRRIAAARLLLAARCDCAAVLRIRGPAAAPAAVVDALARRCAAAQCRGRHARR